MINFMAKNTPILQNVNPSEYGINGDSFGCLDGCTYSAVMSCSSCDLIGHESGCESVCQSDCMNICSFGDCMATCVSGCGDGCWLQTDGEFWCKPGQKL